MKNFSTGRLSGLFNVVIPGVAACNARGSQPLKNTTRFPNPAGRYSFGNDVARGYLRGFTLIELLVVVLIIGILSAVALPQYQKAVMKSKMTQGFVTLRAIDTAQEEYFLANGVYSDDLDNLSISVDKTMLSCKNGETGRFCQVWVAEGLAMELVLTRIKQSDLLRCLAANSRAEQICASFGGTKFREQAGISYYAIPYKY